MGLECSNTPIINNWLHHVLPMRHLQVIDVSTERELTTYVINSDVQSTGLQYVHTISSVSIFYFSKSKMCLQNFVPMWK